jgi:uncharacterized protein (TIGR03084 family)
MADLELLLVDLTAESDELDALVAPLDAAGWRLPTPAAGWTIAHQISHLAWTDRQAITAATDPDAFHAHLAAMMEDAQGVLEAGAAEGGGADPAALLARWRDGRNKVRQVLRAVPPGGTIPWYGPPMRPGSMATARLMETWAHGLDVADALGVTKASSHRLRHVAHLGVRTRDFAYRNRGLTPPTAPVRVVLTAPDGAEWTWGPDDAEQSVTGPALDFCLLVTQRRNRADLNLIAKGSDADHWLNIAQAFAGPSGPGRPPAG